jgi:hypothetical protein
MIAGDAIVARRAESGVLFPIKAVGFVPREVEAASHE